MLYNEYEKILTKGKKVEWYETEVPEKLLTDVVKSMANQIVEQINKYEGVDSNQKKDYIYKLWDSVRLLPYRLNGDFYLVKKKEIEEKNKKSKPKTEKVITEQKRTTKNSNLIFGNKK